MAQVSRNLVRQGRPATELLALYRLAWGPELYGSQRHRHSQVVVKGGVAVVKAASGGLSSDVGNGVPGAVVLRAVEKILEATTFLSRGV